PSPLAAPLPEPLPLDFPDFPELLPAALPSVFISPLPSPFISPLPSVLPSVLPWAIELAGRTPRAAAEAATARAGRTGSRRLRPDCSGVDSFCSAIAAPLRRTGVSVSPGRLAPLPGAGKYASSTGCQAREARQIGSERLRNGHGAVGLLVVLEDGDEG